LNNAIVFTEKTPLLQEKRGYKTSKDKEVVFYKTLKKSTWLKIFSILLLVTTAVAAIAIAVTTIEAKKGERRAFIRVSGRIIDTEVRCCSQPFIRPSHA